MEKRIQWADLPIPLEAAIESAQGRSQPGARSPTGRTRPSPPSSTPATARCSSRDCPPITPRHHPGTRGSRRPARVPPLPGPAVALRRGRMERPRLRAHPRPGRRLQPRLTRPRSGRLPHGNAEPRPGSRRPRPSKRAEDRWKTYTDDPADALTLAGGSLAHTDWMPDNILIAHGRAWLVDWAWPTLAAAWIDPASWLLRIMARGHTTAKPKPTPPASPPTPPPTPPTSTSSSAPTSACGTGVKDRPPRPVDTDHGSSRTRLGAAPREPGRLRAIAPSATSPPTRHTCMLPKAGTARPPRAPIRTGPQPVALQEARHRVTGERPTGRTARNKGRP